MIISKTPFRISFFGGGSDYPEWYRENGGCVVSTTIDKYCFISLRNLPNFFEHNYRIVYSLIENVKNIRDINHPSVREVLTWKKINIGLEIHHDGDLPARSGLGSSSAFTVGLLNALEAYEGKIISKKKLATDAINIEQNIIKEKVGSQDQIACSYGGFNKITFNYDNSFSVDPIILLKNRSSELNKNLMLFFTGKTRIAAEIAADKINNIKNRSKELFEIMKMVDNCINIIQTKNSNLDEIGYLLDQTWKIKKSLSSKVSNNFIDDIYDLAKNNGALGGKLLGAGGGGFILFYVPLEKQKNIIKALNKLTYVPFKFENEGSSIVLYEPNGL